MAPYSRFQGYPPQLIRDDHSVDMDICKHNNIQTTYIVPSTIVILCISVRDLTRLLIFFPHSLETQRSKFQYWRHCNWQRWVFNRNKRFKSYRLRRPYVHWNIHATKSCGQPKKFILCLENIDKYLNRYISFKFRLVLKNISLNWKCC